MMFRLKFGFCRTVGIYIAGTFIVACILTIVDYHQRSILSETWKASNQTHPHFGVEPHIGADPHVGVDPHIGVENNLYPRPTPHVDSNEDSIGIDVYLKHQEWICQQIVQNKTENGKKTARPWCPCLPSILEGRLAVKITDDINWEELERKIGTDVLIGGEWKPSICTSHTRLAVIIPCRDRDSHLRILLRHLYPILQKQLVHFRIFVIDQNLPALFNKAAIMNIGFVEAIKRFQADCIMFHDVDHLLEDDRTLMRCGQHPHHYAIAIDDWGYRILYTAAFGGVVTLTPDMFKQVNGFSNQYFGWGGEDDDMGTRVRQFFKIDRPPDQIARYTTLKHEPDGGNPKNNNRHALMDDQWKKYQSGSYDGLTDLNYTIANVQSRNLFTWIQANIDVTQLPHYPSYETNKYVKFEGVCLNQVNIIESYDVTWMTCRYMCDRLETKPCYGFSFQPQVAATALGFSSQPQGVVTVTAWCSLLTTVCQLSTSEGGSTYIIQR